MAQKYVMINDIIKEHNARMYNLRKYYPFFVLSETTFAQYKEGRYAGLDMGYITMGVLRFLIQENSMNEREVTYDEYEEFMGQLLDRDFDVEIKTEDRKELIAEYQKRHDIMQEYAPKLLSKEEVQKIVTEQFAEVLATKNKGQIMKTVMPHLKGKADGKVINEVITELTK